MPFNIPLNPSTIDLVPFTNVVADLVNFVTPMIRAASNPPLISSIRPLALKPAIDSDMPSANAPIAEAIMSPTFSNKGATPLMMSAILVNIASNRPISFVCFDTESSFLNPSNRDSNAPTTPSTIALRGASIAFCKVSAALNIPVDFMVSLRLTKKSPSPAAISRSEPPTGAATPKRLANVPTTKETPCPKMLNKARKPSNILFSLLNVPSTPLPASVTFSKFFPKASILPLSTKASKKSTTRSAKSRITILRIPVSPINGCKASLTEFIAGLIELKISRRATRDGPATSAPILPRAVRILANEPVKVSLALVACSP